MFLNNENPLSCGEMHKQIHGGDGYSTTTRWCRILMDKFVLANRKIKISQNYLI
jgi:hypothetical protein